MPKKERQSNIELLRIMAILGVIVLHYNNPLIGGGLVYAKDASVNKFVLYFLESIFACAVDLFMLISGYFMCESKKRNLWRPIELIIQVMVFREVIYLGRVCLQSTPFSLKTFFSTLIPSNYFVILYCVVYILSPWINIIIEKISSKSFRAFVIVVFLTFSVYPTFIDVIGEIRGDSINGLSSIGMYGSQWGYSIVNFFMMFVMGAYIKKGILSILNVKTWKIFSFMLLDVMLIMAWAIVNDKTGFLTERSAWEYCNPFVVCAAVLLFILFSRISIGVNKVINKFAEGVFSVFLAHQIFLEFLGIEKIVKGNVILMLVHIFGCAIAIYLVCWCIHLVYHLITDPIFRFLSKKINLQIIDVDIN